MFDLSKINYKSKLGKIIRIPLRVIPGNVRIPVIQGYNKGFKWIKGSGVNGYWLGHYEFFKQRIFVEFVKKGMIAYDIGTHAGFFTLLFSRLVGETGHVYSFEPNPRNLFYLQKHVKINNVKNVTVLPVAIGKDNKISFFDDETNSSMGYLTENKGNIMVPVFNLDFFVKNNLIKPPDIIKIDVEGSEKDVIEGSENLIKEFRPVIQISIDNPENKKFILDFLKDKDYEIIDLTGNYKEVIVIPSKP